MPIAATGAVSFSDLRTEFVGGSSAISYSDLYRGGSNIRAKAGNNNGVNLAASVPTSGTINITNFRNQAKGFRYSFSAHATNQNASALFGSDYSVNYPKFIVINGGIELGATSTSEEALEIDSGGVGDITITNNGTLTGAGGAAGQAGGDAFEAAVTCTFINNGTVRAGGGGGGTGGNGYYSSTSSSSPGYSNAYRWYRKSNVGIRAYWGNGAVPVAYNSNINTTSVSAGGATYTRGSFYTNVENGEAQVYRISRTATATTYTNGGAGGVGEGYGNFAGSGAGGGTNAGTGGTGGSFGASGSTGSNGNSSNGSAGGASGAYLRGASFVTFTNNATVLGGTA